MEAREREHAGELNIAEGGFSMVFWGGGGDVSDK